MCNENTQERIPALSLQATILATLVRGGVHINDAEPLSHQLIGVFASSEVAHPCWSAHVLGEHEEQEEPAQGEAQTGMPANEEEARARGFSVVKVTIGSNGVAVEGDDDAAVPAIVKAIAEQLGARLNVKK